MSFKALSREGKDGYGQFVRPSVALQVEEVDNSKAGRLSDLSF